MVGSSPPGVATFFRKKLVKMAVAFDGRGHKWASVTTISKNVTTFCSLAVLRGGFVKFHNLFHGLTGLTPLVHFWTE